MCIISNRSDFSDLDGGYAISKRCMSAYYKRIKGEMAMRTRHNLAGQPQKKAGPSGPASIVFTTSLANQLVRQGVLEVVANTNGVLHFIVEITEVLCDGVITAGRAIFLVRFCERRTSAR